MATYLEIYTLSQDIDLQNRIHIAVIKAATSILGEAIGAMKQAQTNKRQILAKSVLSGSINISLWTLTVCNNSTIATNGVLSTDAQLDSAISSLWDDMSGVVTLDLA